ncbi:unnamed protein product, partial [Polarella glacialis]
ARRISRPTMSPTMRHVRIPRTSLRAVAEQTWAAAAAIAAAAKVALRSPTAKQRPAPEARSRQQEARARRQQGDAEGGAASSALSRRQGMLVIRRWRSDGARLAVAITSDGLEGVVKRELMSRFGQSPASMGGRACFRWLAPGVGSSNQPVLQSARSVVVLFSLAFEEDFKTLQSRVAVSGNFIKELATYARDAVESEQGVAFADALGDSMRGDDLPELPSFVVSCQPSGRGSEKAAFGSHAALQQMEAALQEGVRKATGWVIEPQNPDVKIVAFVGE